MCISLAFIIAMFATPYPQIAMWVGFLFAAYAAIANDSIQTIGTFIASNQDKKWWILWIFIAGIFCITMTYSWLKVDESGVTVISKTSIIKDINIDRDSHSITWKLNGGENTFTSNFSTNYFNKDYGTCFFVDDMGQMCEVINMKTAEETHPSVKNTFNKYVEIEYIVLASGEENIYLINSESESDDLIFDLYPDGIPDGDVSHASSESESDDLIFDLYPDGIPDGDVSHARLSAKGFEKAPKHFHFLQVSAAIFLLILTRLRMPVSTTFILLTSFAASTSAVGKVLAKSMSGYIMAFVLGLVFFILVARFSKKYFVGKVNPVWVIAQWMTSGLLWATWLTQDAANIAVYLPRTLSVLELITFIGIVTVGLGVLLYYKGGRIQKIVTEKSVVTDVRFATLIDLIYCVILFYFKMHSKVPMSTTWVFIGLLAGRELGMSIMKTGNNTILGGLRLAFKDIAFAFIGLFVSIVIAVGVNSDITYSEVLYEIPNAFSSGISDFFKKLN
ncbi:MAG: hypothetical protein EGP10_01515 [SAR202 cluster bacterium]|nr:MAG: hypothetical protein EGP10_01515 [SAR202 cluster bacterium]